MWKNRKAYWELLNKLKRDSKEKPENNININDWKQYFTELNSQTESKEELRKISEKLVELENMKTFNDLDFKISAAEVSKAVKLLRNAKAFGFNMILKKL